MDAFSDPATRERLYGSFTSGIWPNDKWSIYLTRITEAQHNVQMQLLRGTSVMQWPAWQPALDEIIMEDEGGWKLTPASDDDDGGWTFAGITRKTWVAYFSEQTGESEWDKWTFEAIKHFIVSDLDDAKYTVYRIYETKYIAPLIRGLVGSGSDPRRAALSCAVNCGPETAINLWISDRGAGFIANWMRHYIDICKANPDKLRYLKGWFNRTERYRA